jgi:MFS family permease
MELSMTSLPYETRSVPLRIAPFVVMIFLGYLAVGLPLATIPLYVHDTLGFSDLMVGIAVATQSVVTLLTRPFAGGLCDRAGPKRCMLLGSAATLLAGLVSWMAASVAGPQASLGVLLAGRMVLGLAESLVMTGGLTWAIGTVGAPHTGKAMVWVGIAMYAAIAAGAPLGLRLMSGGFGLVALVATTLAIPVAALAVALAPVAPSGGERLPFFKVALRIAPFGSGLALATIGFGAIAAFAAIDFQSKGWTEPGLVLGGFGAAYIIARLLFGSWPDRFGGVRVARWSLSIESAGQALLWLAPSPVIAIGGAVLSGLGFSLVFPSFGIEAVKRVPAASRGSALGAYAAFFDIGVGVSGPLTGLIAGKFGYPSVFAVGALAAGAAIGLTRQDWILTQQAVPSTET